MNVSYVTLSLSTAIQQFRDGFDCKYVTCKWVIKDFIENCLYYWNTTTGKILPPMCLCSGKMWKSNVKNIFCISFPILACWSEVTWCHSVVLKFHNCAVTKDPSTKWSQARHIKIKKKKKKKKTCRNKTYPATRKMTIVIEILWQALILPMIGLYCINMWK